jgi:hypothetical protein
MADHKLARELLVALGADLSNFHKGGMLPAAGLTIISASVLDLGTAVTAGAHGKLGYRTHRRQGIALALRRRSAIRAYDLYDLYEVDRRLAPRIAATTIKARVTKRFIRPPKPNERTPNSSAGREV